MSTHTEQDCLTKIGQMQTWRANAGTALENKHVIADSSTTLLADMPPLIRAAGGTLYARFDKTQYVCRYPDNLTFTMNIISNTSWTLTGDSSPTFSPSSGTGCATVTVTCPTSGSYQALISRNFTMRLNSSAGCEMAIITRRKT